MFSFPRDVNPIHLAAKMASSEKEESWFDRLSDDVILCILKHLHLKDYYNLRNVNKRFEGICMDKSLVRYALF